MASIYELMLKPSQDTHTARSYQRGLGDAAAQAGITVQLCMPVASDVLESVENRAARYIRLSDDYSTNPQQWRIGRPGMLAHAVGLTAIKDTFWSVSVQPPGNPTYGNFTEPNPELQAAVSLLSAAQVAVGDAIGYTNVSLVMRTCTNDGRLLRVKRPALPIDATFRFAQPAQGEVWHTFAAISGRQAGTDHTTHYVFSANLSDPFRFVPQNDFIDGPVAAQYAVYDAVEPSSALTPTMLPQSGNLSLQACPARGSVAPFHLYVLAPVLDGSWALLGDTSKLVPVTPVRFQQLASSASSLSASVLGTAGEVVQVDVLAPDKRVLRATCTFPGTTAPGQWREGMPQLQASVHCTTAACTCR